MIDELPTLEEDFEDEDHKECPECGELLERDAEFCDDCGFTFDVIEDEDYE